MNTDMTSRAALSATPPMPGLHTPDRTSNAPPHYVQPQVHKVELAPIPVSTVQFDRSTMEKSLKAAVKLLNDQMSAQAQGLAFSYDESTNSPVVTVRNLESGQVVKQIPSVDLLRLAHKMDDLKGILYNAKA